MYTLHLYIEHKEIFSFKKKLIEKNLWFFQVFIVTLHPSIE